jgi:hypothetical protein
VAACALECQLCRPRVLDCLFTYLFVCGVALVGTCMQNRAELLRMLKNMNPFVGSVESLGANTPARAKAT